MDTYTAAFVEPIRGRSSFAVHKQIFLCLNPLLNMFNRDRIPGLSGSSPRPPQRNDGSGRPPAQQYPPPRSSGPDTRMGGYDDRSQHGYGGPPPGAQRMPTRGTPGGGAPARQLRPIKSPGGNAYAFGNLCVRNLYSPKNTRANGQ